MAQSVSIKTVAAPSASAVAAATAVFVANIATSNRLGKDAMEFLASAFKAVTLGEGEGIEITHLLAVGKSPAYNVGRSRIGSAAYRTLKAEGSKATLWQSLNVVTLVETSQKGNVVTGTPSTTATVGRTFLTAR